jgi:hypothetical protein
MAELRNQFARAWQIAKINPAVCQVACPRPPTEGPCRSKMFDGAVPQVLKTEKRFVGHVADFADCLQARGR